MLSVNVVRPLTVMVHTPFAAPFPVTSAITTVAPVESPCCCPVVIWIGVANDASVTISGAGTMQRSARSSSKRPSFGSVG